MNERDLLSALTTLIEAEVAAADDDTCGELLGPAQSARGRLDAIGAQITSRLRQLHDELRPTPVRTRRRAAA